MGRWEPGAEGRLTQAAFDLFAENGYESTTVAQIAARAGVTERTFFRYFADKREVLFAGGRMLEDSLTRQVEAARPDESPRSVVEDAFERMTRESFADRQAFARARATVIRSSPDLQERELLKLASMTTALADALAARGVAEPDASLLAQAGVAVFHTAFAQWLAPAETRPLDQLVRGTFDRLRSVVG
jgi:AcrR family transcriptional regulator